VCVYMCVCVCVCDKSEIVTRLVMWPSYLLYCTCVQSHADAVRDLQLAEADASGEQQLKRTQSRSSSWSRQKWSGS